MNEMHSSFRRLCCSAGTPKSLDCPFVGQYAECPAHEQVVLAKLAGDLNDAWCLTDTWVIPEVDFLGTREQQGEGDCLGVGVSELVLVEPREQKVLPVLPEPQ